MHLFLESPVAAQLKVLRVSNCSSLSWTTLEMLSMRLPGLKELDISGLNELADHHLMALADLTELEVLSVGSSLANGNFLACLAELPHLRMLSLQGCNSLTDSDMKQYFPGWRDQHSGAHPAPRACVCVCVCVCWGGGGGERRRETDRETETEKFHGRSEQHPNNSTLLARRICCL